MIDNEFSRMKRKDYEWNQEYYRRMAERIMEERAQRFRLMFITPVRILPSDSVPLPSNTDELPEIAKGS